MTQIPPRPIASVLIVEDHPLFCDALSITLQIVGGISSVRTTSSIADCLRQLAAGPQPDAVFLDLNLPDADGLDGLLKVRKAAPDAALLIVSSLTSPAIVNAAIEFGASGYVPKHSQRQVFQDALSRIAQGGIYLPEGFAPADPAAARPLALTRDRLDSLTAQQSRILSLISEGKLNKQIAHDLDIAESTVKAHVTVIMRKLGVQTRTQAVLAAQAARFDSLAAR
ncbi:Transcriptional regulatory protein DevR (DosR) [Paracoccus haematequi]|uniref:Transcriptional regulatory protein DevR (DosR) n=1 Tax=Paracoccus haematequi TaxID=2491866 RepID=A0A3S5D472_9RHOB|nr:response regulator transcription factor [Paracoccus haematequi]VDS09797.1 Transcriptional regulatory protein DevR (DosR) [Paracoccus haematequi]